MATVPIDDVVVIARLRALGIVDHEEAQRMLDALVEGADDE